MKRAFVWLGSLFFFTMVWISLAFAQETNERPVFTLQTTEGSVAIYTEWLNEDLWLFLPSFAQLDQLSVEGGELEWWESEPDEEGIWYVDIIQGEETETIYVMRSANLRTLFLYSDDPVNQGRNYIEDCLRHENETTGSLALVNTQGMIDHVERISSLRGRGNTTWLLEKRPYQIKLADKTDLLDTGDDANRARTWVLIAEMEDATLLHNKITADLAGALGIAAMECEHVDLYYDGEYRGAYLLSEKVEVGEGRVEIQDYDKLLKKWNNKVGQRDLEVLPALEAVNDYGNTFTYIDGVVESTRPDAGGFFVEMESQYATLSDRCYFFLTYGNEKDVYAVKNPENASQNMMRYISERLQEAQNTLRSRGGGKPSNRTNRSG